MALLKCSSSRRSSTRGCRIGILPIPVATARSRCRPLRTTNRWPASSRRSWNRSMYSTTSRSIASDSIRRAPSRQTASRAHVVSIRARVPASTSIYCSMSVSSFPLAEGFGLVFRSPKGYALFLCTVYSLGPLIHTFRTYLPRNARNTRKKSATEDTERTWKSQTTENAPRWQERSQALPPRSCVEPGPILTSRGEGVGMNPPLGGRS